MVLSKEGLAKKITEEFRWIHQENVFIFWFIWSPSVDLVLLFIRNVVEPYNTDFWPFP